MRVFLKFFQLRQVLAQSVIGGMLVAFAVSKNAVMSARQRYEVVMHLRDDTHIALQMTVAFMVLYLVFIGSQCFTSYQSLTPIE